MIKICSPSVDPHIFNSTDYVDYSYYDNYNFTYSDDVELIKNILEAAGIAIQAHARICDARFDFSSYPYYTCEYPILDALRLWYSSGYAGYADMTLKEFVIKMFSSN